MRTILLYNKYLLSEDGKLLNIKTNKYIKENITPNNYALYRMQFNGVKQTKLIHRLLALNFIDNPRNCKFVNHIDGNKLNNNINNLEWVTPSENSIHAYRILGVKPNKPNKKVRCLITGNIYNSVKETAKILGYNHITLCNKLNPNQLNHINNTNLEYV
jgi:hypothetical protein